MHIFFAGIGGAGIGPLALIAKQAGFEVSGSDKQDSQYLDYLKKHGLTDINIGQTEAAIAELHHQKPIDWYVYSSALPKENPNHPELAFVKNSGIKHSKRDEFLNFFLTEKNLKLIAIAGTHGKTTTTAMLIWLFKQLKLPVSYSVGAKLGFGDMGEYNPASQYFIYECDEYDRNFLAFQPHLSLITGVTWDHHEIFTTAEGYQAAFNQFLDQSNKAVVWQSDAQKLGLNNPAKYTVLDDAEPKLETIKLAGLVNRQNAWQVLTAVQELTKTSPDELLEVINAFPGLSRRMEAIKPNLYSDYAHTPEKIVGAIGIAKELAAEKQQKLVILYEPLTNRRADYIKDALMGVFEGASAVYWLPSYLAREDANQPVLSPAELIAHLDQKTREIAQPMQFDEQLKAAIEKHLVAGDMVVALTGGGGNSLDEWLRREFKDE